MTVEQPAVPSPVLVVGTGLIGTSVALGLTAAGSEVYLRDIDPEMVELAVKVGAGSGGTVVEPELVVVAVPPSATAEHVDSALREFPDAVVTDVASVKGPLATAIRDPRYVGGHPMAGKERSGPLAASGLLFEGRPWAVVPSEKTSVNSVRTLNLLIKTLGAVPIELDPESHDRAVALVSHVPHLVSVLTAGLLNTAESDQLALAGQGLRDVTRIARSDAGLWVDIVEANSAAIGAVLRELHANLGGLIDIVDAGAKDLEPVLKIGRSGTSRIPGKHGDLPNDVATVYVTIDDAPGELARLLNDTGDANVNIEDLRIDHEVGRPVGLVEILVLPERGQFLVDALNARGWAAYL